jgi:hypothetical protein
MVWKEPHLRHCCSISARGLTSTKHFNSNQWPKYAAGRLPNRTWHMSILLTLSFADKTIWVAQNTGRRQLCGHLSVKRTRVSCMFTGVPPPPCGRTGPIVCSDNLILRSAVHTAHKTYQQKAVPDLRTVIVPGFYFTYFNTLRATVACRRS